MDPRCDDGIERQALISGFIIDGMKERIGKLVFFYPRAELGHHGHYADTGMFDGKTILINHFLINDSWYLVDLPGYGFAKISQSGREELRKMINDYILNSGELVCLFVLVDSRHDIGAIDLDFIAGLGEAGVPFAIIFTKGDKLGPNALLKQIERDKAILSEQWEELPPMIASSAQTGQGRDEILNFIQQYL